MPTPDLAHAAALLASDFVALVVVQDRRILWANDAMHRLLGYPPDELIGMPTRPMFLDQEAYDAFGRDVADTLARGTAYCQVIPQRRKDGSTGWFEFNISRESGHPDRLVGAIVDRTRSHALSVRLEASEARFRSVLEDQTEVISRILPDGTFVFVNDVYCRVFDKSADELIGKRWHPVAHPDDIEMIESRLREMSPGRPIVVIENRVYVAGGDMRWMQFVNRGFFDSDGHLLEIQSVGRDITRLKEVEIALKKSEAALERAQAVAKIGSFTLKGDSDRFSFTKETGRLFDLDSRHQTCTAEWISRVHPDDREAVAAAWGAALKGEPYDIHYRIVVHGEVVWIRARAELTFDADGALVQCVGTVQDVTSQKRVQDELRMSEAHLEMVLAASGMGWWDLDVTTGQVDVDPRITQILGYASAELGQRAFWDQLRDPRDRDRFERELNAHYRGDTAEFANDHRLRHRDGHWVAVETRGKVTERDLTGQPRRMVGTLMDITQRKRLYDEGFDLLRQVETLIRDSAADRRSIDAASNALAQLTRRETQILGLIAKGLSSREIAERLNVSVNTIGTHRHNVMSKLGLHTTADATRFAMEHGLLPRS